MIVVGHVDAGKSTLIEICCSIVAMFVENASSMKRRVLIWRSVHPT